MSGRIARPTTALGMAPPLRRVLAYYARECYPLGMSHGMTVFVSALVAAIIREGYTLITGKEMFPARAQPQWMQRMLRRCGLSSLVVDELRLQQRREEQERLSAPSERPEHRRRR